MKYDTIIRGGRVYDGTGDDGRIADVGIKDRVIVAIEDSLPAEPGATEIDAKGCWVTPGFIDLHTHYDAELEIEPQLFESVRHGVTTVMTGSCSLSMAVGDTEDLADMFCRVEGIPREVVLPLFRKIKTWNSPAEYLDHLEGKPLGPNVACLLGHSTIRAASMGMERALDKHARPTPIEMGEMEAWLAEALDAGYVGLSISTLPWDKMDGDIFRSRPMPSVFATWREYRRLARQLRARGRVLQGVPNITTKLNVLLFMAISSGIFRKALKTTLISMMDIKADRFAFWAAGHLARICNRFLGGDFRMQALPNVFDLWADGIDLVVFEEFEAGTAALHVKDEMRIELLRDPAYRERFKKQWRNKLLPRAYHRNFRHSTVLDCPDRTTIGKSFAQLGEERGVDPVDAFLDLVADHGTAVRWYTIMGNDRPEWLQYIVTHPDILIGFSDAGAHLRNMAHYNFPLRLLKLARDSGCMPIGRAVQRLTSEIADWLDLDAGTLALGRRADLVVIDPDELTECVEQTFEAPMPGFPGLDRLVRRNDEAVRIVMINGRIASRRGVPGQDLGVSRQFGRLLRAGSTVQAPHVDVGRLVPGEDSVLPVESDRGTERVSA